MSAGALSVEYTCAQNELQAHLQAAGYRFLTYLRSTAASVTPTGPLPPVHRYVVSGPCRSPRHMLALLLGF